MRPSRIKWSRCRDRLSDPDTLTRIRRMNTNQANKALSQISESDKARFWAKVDKRGEDECWEWKGACHPYGTFSVGGRRGQVFSRAHRFALLFTQGAFPLHTHHRCKNKRCVNPVHLEAVTPREHGNRHRWGKCRNGHDLTPDNTYIINEANKGYPVLRCRLCRIESGNRYRKLNPKPRVPDPKGRGTHHHSAKLTPEIVRNIRIRYASGTITLKQLGTEYGIAFSGISQIVRRKTWKHVP
jgi:HNH endonuclease